VTLEARGLAFGFRDRIVGQALDARFAAGEVTTLLGPNGSGKTTLLRTLLGVLAPQGGCVTLEGRDLAQWKPRERSARLAYVPQETASAFDFTVAELVGMARIARRGVFASPSRADVDATHACLDRLGIDALAERPMHALSGGERQLVLIARAMATGATHILMDEPTANLDFANQSLILGQLARLARDGASVVFTTHHPDDGLRVADRALLLRGGKLLASGPAAGTINSENLSALYGCPVEVAELRSPGGGVDRFCIVRESGAFD
jgi:iron complex transport system ATP-binding protein